MSMVQFQTFLLTCYKLDETIHPIWYYVTCLSMKGSGTLVLLGVWNWIMIVFIKELWHVWVRDFPSFFAPQRSCLQSLSFSMFSICRINLFIDLVLFHIFVTIFLRSKTWTCWSIHKGRFSRHDVLRLKLHNFKFVA